jgi:hypothetical protein
MLPASREGTAWDKCDNRLSAGQEETVGDMCDDILPVGRGGGTPLLAAQEGRGGEVGCPDLPDREEAVLDGLLAASLGEDCAGSVDLAVNPCHTEDDLTPSTLPPSAPGGDGDKRLTGKRFRKSW